MELFIKDMPKIELHAHLNGSLSTEALLELGALRYGQTNKEFENLVQSFKVMGESLEECFKKFKIAHDVTNTQDTLRRATICVIRDFAKDNVIYVELRTTPKQTENMTKLQYLQWVLDAIRTAKTEFPQITVKLLPSIDRSQGIESAKSSMEAVFALQKEYSNIIKGIDLSGNPAVERFDTYKEILSMVRESGLHITLHCGEIENNTEIAEMIRFGMDRCGHGTLIKGENLQKMLDEKIPVECCLSSNVKCGTVPTYDVHHFKYLLDNNHPVMICTDDFGVFDTTLTNEFVIAYKTFKLTKDDLLKLSKNAIESSFASEEEKECLRQQVDNYFREHVNKL